MFDYSPLSVGTWEARIRFARIFGESEGRHSEILRAFSWLYDIALPQSSTRQLLYAVIDICIFSNTKESGGIPRRNLFAACFSRYLESSANDTVHVCGLKRVRSNFRDISRVG